MHSGSEMLTDIIFLAAQIRTGNMDRTLRFDKTTNYDTAYFRGIDIIMCT